MKTALVTTCWLENEEYLNKTIKWINYYKDLNTLKFEDIILLENASDWTKHLTHLHGAIVKRFDTHIARTSHLEYGYLWRAVYHYQELFKEYDKIIYMDNDAYLISDKIITDINNIKSGWHTFFCQKHKFPETGIQVICKDSLTYNNFVKDLSQQEFINKYNGLTMESTLPIENVYKIEYNGDRWSEYGITEQQPGWDFSTQTPLSMIIKKE